MDKIRTKLWLESRKTTVDVHGEIVKEIACTRGLRQGDPLSPLIFTLIVGLNMIIEKIKKGWMLGLPANKRANIMILQYADGALQFVKTNIDEAVVMKWALASFELWSGLKINFGKSQLVFLEKQDLRTNIIE